MKKIRINSSLIFFLILSIFILPLGGCDWFGKGLFNILDPEAEVKMYYTVNQDSDVIDQDTYGLLSGMTFDLVVYPLNEIGFTINTLEYRYYSDGVLIPELSKDISANYYIPPNPYNPFPGAGNESINVPSGTPYKFEGIPLIFQDTIDYLWKNYELENITLTLTAIIEDDARHAITKPVIQNFPVLQMGEDFMPPEVEILPEGDVSFPAGSSVTLIAQASDNYMIKSYKWMVSGGGGCSSCGGGSSFSSEGQVFTRTFSDPGTYSVVVEVCDFAGNCSYAAKTIEITGGEEE